MISSTRHAWKHMRKSVAVIKTQQIGVDVYCTCMLASTSVPCEINGSVASSLC